MQPQYSAIYSGPLMSQLLFYSFALDRVPIVSPFFIVDKQKKKVVVLFVVYPLCQNYQLGLYFKVPNRPAPE